jgi:predicted DNA-binding protein
MTAKNPRINVTFEEKTVGLLTHLAQQENKSVARVVKELTYEALEMHEDIYLSSLAEKLDKPGTKTYSHTQAWK